MAYIAFFAPGAREGRGDATADPEPGAAQLAPALTGESQLQAAPAFGLEVQPAEDLGRHSEIEAIASIAVHSERSSPPVLKPRTSALSPTSCGRLLFL